MICDDSVLARFNAKVGPVNEDGCMEWTACRDWDGYGHFNLNGRTVKAHRLSLVIHQGIDFPPPEIEAMHSCNTPSCVNPEHLKWGTDKENTRYRDECGHTAHGEGHGMHKLTSAQVMEIHQLYSSGGYSQTELGRRFGVSSRQIGYIVRGERWTEEYEQFHGLQPGVDSRENAAVA